MYRILYQPIIFLVFVYNNLYDNDISGIASILLIRWTLSLSHINTCSNSCTGYPTSYQTWSAMVLAERLILDRITLYKDIDLNSQLDLTQQCDEWGH